MLEGLISAVAGFAAATIGKQLTERAIDAVLDEFGVQVVEAVLQTQDEQRATLRNLDRNVDALLRGAYRAGMIFLAEAGRRTRPLTERREFLDKARDRFFEALGTEGRFPVRRAQIRIALSAAAVAKDDWIEAERPLEYATLDLLEAAHARMKGNVWVGWWNRAGEVLPALDAVRGLRIALGAMSRSLPDFTLPARDSGIANPVELALLNRRVRDRARYRASTEACVERFLIEPTESLLRFSASPPSLGAPPRLSIEADRVATWLARSEWGPNGLRFEAGIDDIGAEPRLLAKAFAAERRADWPQRHLHRWLSA